jgi:myo-inositol-1(or 4)-monophosphatase
MNTADDLARAVAAVQQAFVVLRAHAARPVEYEHKHDGGLVTAADRDVDDLLRALLPTADDGWLSEETVDDERRLHCRRVWVVDPLDGTRAFVARRPEYTVSVALVVDGVPVLGVVGNPAVDVVIAGGPGLGLELSGEPGLGFDAADPRPCLMVSRSEHRRGEWGSLQPHCQLRPCGSVAYELAMVAAGRADATWTLHPKHEWDVAAGAALVEAAGGRVWLPRGGHLRWNRSRPRFLSFGAVGAGRRAALGSWPPGLA